MSSLSFKKALLTGMVAFIVTVCGCRQSTETTIAGLYVRINGGMVESINVYTNGSFVQTVKTAEGKKYELNDKWSVNGSNVRFDSLYITFNIETQSNMEPVRKQNVDVKRDGNWLVVEPVTGYAYEKNRKKAAPTENK